MAADFVFSQFSKLILSNFLFIIFLNKNKCKLSSQAWLSLVCKVLHVYHLSKNYLKIQSYLRINNCLFVFTYILNNLKFYKCAKRKTLFIFVVIVYCVAFHLKIFFQKKIILKFNNSNWTTHKNKKKENLYPTIRKNLVLNLSDSMLVITSWYLKNKMYKNE